MKAPALRLLACSALLSFWVTTRWFAITSRTKAARQGQKCPALHAGAAHNSAQTRESAQRAFRQSAEHVPRRLLRQARELGSALEEAHHQPHASRLQNKRKC